MSIASLIRCEATASSCESLAGHSFSPSLRIFNQEIARNLWSVAELPRRFL